VGINCESNFSLKVGHFYQKTFKEVVIHFLIKMKDAKNIKKISREFLNYTKSSDNMKNSELLDLI
jgi:hypothetical protein